MKKILFALVAIFATANMAIADDHRSHLSLGTNILYERGWDATLSYEYSTSYHNAWEFFGNVYLKWDDCESCGHVCPDSFWKNYRSWTLGTAYKPCVVRNRNNHGNIRAGFMLGSDTDRFIGGFTLGYEHSYSLKGGWELFWNVKSDLVIKGEDLFRTGVGIGVKLPL